MANQYDMGTGSIKRLMVQMAVPALVGQVVNLLYNIVDRIYIGHLPEIGGTALTGVGLFAPILMLLTAFALLAGSGGAPRAAIAMGQGNRERAEQIMGNCFAVLLILSALLYCLRMPMNICPPCSQNTRVSRSSAMGTTFFQNRSAKNWSSSTQRLLHGSPNSYRIPIRSFLRLTLWTRIGIILQSILSRVII